MLLEELVRYDGRVIPKLEHVVISCFMDLISLLSGGLLAAAAEAEPTSTAASPLLLVLTITLGAFLTVCLGMAVGVIFGRKPIGGSCGGIGGVIDENGNTSCALCQKPSEDCEQLRQHMEQQSSH